MATYAEVQKLVSDPYDRSVKTCWIAHVKEMNGLPLRKAPNRQSPAWRVEPCPDWARPMIEDAMRRLGML